MENPSPPGTITIPPVYVPGPVGPTGPPGPPGTVEAAGPGSASAPSISFLADGNTGLYNPAPDTTGFATGGTERMTLGPSGLLTVGTGESVLFGHTVAPRALEILCGSAVSPVTVEIPTIRINHMEDVPSSANPVNNYNNAAIVVQAYGAPTSVMQPCAIAAMAVSTMPTTDVCTINAMAVSQGARRAAAGYFEARRTVADANGSTHTLEVRSANFTATDGVSLSSGVSDTIGIWINAGGTAKSADGIAIGGVSGQSFSHGLSFKASSLGGPSDVSLSDYSSSTTSLYISGTHTTGLHLADATISGPGILLGNTMPIAWGSPTADLFLVREGANTLAQRNGTNAQDFFIYKTYTNGSNWERLATHTAGAFSILVEQLGTGVGRNLTIGTTAGQNVLIKGNGVDRWNFQWNGMLLALSNNAYDIGASGSAPRNIFVAGAVANRTKAGTPVDADVNTPTDGMLVVDTTASKIWARVGGVWKGVVIA